jgi:hypothetical protein
MWMECVSTWKLVAAVSSAGAGDADGNWHVRDIYAQGVGFLKHEIVTKLPQHERSVILAVSFAGIRCKTRSYLLCEHGASPGMRYCNQS